MKFLTDCPFSDICVVFLAVFLGFCSQLYFNLLATLRMLINITIPRAAVGATRHSHQNILYCFPLRKGGTMPLLQLASVIHYNGTIIVSLKMSSLFGGLHALDVGCR